MASSPNIAGAVVANRNTSPDFTIFVSKVPFSATCTIGQGGSATLGDFAIKIKRGRDLLDAA
jgi:hypothetical protein